MLHLQDQLRKDQGKTLEDVAKIVGVGKSTVRKWETGLIANMRRDKILKLAKALETTPAYLMGWKEDDSTSNKKDDTISDIILRLSSDADFRQVVEGVSHLKKDRLSAVKAFLSAFK